MFHGPNWNGATPLQPPRPVGDVSCNNQLTIQDAIFIAQYSVGNRTLSASCPLGDPITEIGPGGDVNGDGRVSVADAILVAQCASQVPNEVCPA